jgi:hypothetical protein
LKYIEKGERNNQKCSKKVKKLRRTPRPTHWTIATASKTHRLSSFYEIVEYLLEPLLRGSHLDVHFNVRNLWAALRLRRFRNDYSHTLEMPKKLGQKLLFDVVTGD